MLKRERILGLDVARALAVFGMIFVNFKVVMAGSGEGWLWRIADIFDGKAAATFVVLAGIGMTLMTDKRPNKSGIARQNKAKYTLLKRAVFLFIVGLLYTPLWPGDILHFYGAYIVIALLLLRVSDKVLLASVFGFVFVFIILFVSIDYEAGWDWNIVEYAGFWTPVGFIRNLLFNGFHPVFPWTGLLLFGMWLGRRDIADPRTGTKILLISIAIFALTNAVSYLFLFLSCGYIDFGIANDDFKYVVGTSPMPPLPLYLLAGASFAAGIIIICVKLSRKFADSFIIRTLADTGLMALTHYVAHVVIGMGILYVFNSLEGHSLEFALVYAAIFCAISTAFSVIWRKRFRNGPLEWLMRKVTG